MGKLQNIEIWMLLITVTFLVFTAININQVVGNLMVIITIAAGLFFLIDQDRTIPFRKQSQTLFGSVLGGALGYVALIILATVVVVPGIDKIVALLSSTTPVLSSNVFFNKLIFGFFVPIAESMFFFAALPGLMDNLLNVKFKRDQLFTPKVWMSVIVISLIFSFMHLTAKGITAYSTLAVVFVMAVISLFLVIWNESYESAIYFHIISNAITLIM